jgi:SM-20-related protein
MEQATLKLKTGASHVCSFSDSRSLQALLAKVADPASGNAPLLTLRSPQGDVVDVAVSDVSGIEVAPPFCMVRDFLGPLEIEAVTAFALAHADAFQDSTVSLPATQGASNPDYRLRRSQILNELGPVMPSFLPTLERLIPQLWQHLRTPPIPFNKIECQLAYHGDGGYFKTHMDNGLPDVAHRRVSYVYYFHREPRQFSGGHLRLFNTLIENGVSTCGSLLVDLEPPRNSLVVFPSTCWHEVTPIESASSEIADLRLTMNGWLCV